MTQYIPRPGDFEKADLAETMHQISRPSLSYWQDAWIRLKKNGRALISLYIVLSLLIFTLLGPVIWRVDPAKQDLDQISQPMTLGRKALIVSSANAWETPVAEDIPESSNTYAEDLAKPEGLKVNGTPTTQAVRITWAPVEGASGYAIYRSEVPPGLDALGIPLDEISVGNVLGYQDRMNLEPITYYYSIVPMDATDESENFSSVKVRLQMAISLQKAVSMGIEARENETIRLSAHPFGTDYLGRDMLARLMFGARVSLFIGIIGPLLYILIGTIYGGFAGYMMGKIDAWMMRFADFVIALPFLLFMILFKIAFGIGPGESGVFPMLISLVVLMWPATARLVRGQILQIRDEGFVQASRLLGAKTGYLILRHMIPNAMGSILVTLTFSVPSAIFIEAFLSFIGMGVAPPTPSWGSMCNEGIKTMMHHPHELIFPALFISISVLAFNLLGDGLRDALDSKLRSRE